MIQQNLLHISTNASTKTDNIFKFPKALSANPLPPRQPKPSDVLL